MPTGDGRYRRRTRWGRTRYGTSRAERRAILARDRVCVYCGSTADLQVDHVRPVWWGGRNTEDNLVAACRPCNRDKGARLDWPGLERLATAGNPEAARVVARVERARALYARVAGHPIFQHESSPKAPERSPRDPAPPPSVE